MGTVENRGVAGLLAKSPYLRRLQNVCYFSDLSSILETSYEQHIIGTSKIMTKFSRALHRTYAQLTLKILRAIDKKIREAIEKKEEKNEKEEKKEKVDIKSDYDNAKSGDGNSPPLNLSPFQYDNAKRRLFTFYNYLVDEYQGRLTRVGEISSILGMLAIPPYRRPYGTPLKRTYIKLLIDKLYREQIDEEQIDEVYKKKCLTTIVKNIGAKYAEFYTNLYECEYKDGKGKGARLECENNVVRPLAWLGFLSDKDVKRLKEQIVDSIRANFNDIFNFDPAKNPYREERVQKFKSILRSSTFLIKYRNLSVILGLAYVTDAVLRYISYKGGPDALSLEELEDLADALFLAGEAALVNNMASLSYPLDFYFTYIKRKDHKCNELEGYLVINFYGAKDFVPRSSLGTLEGADYIFDILKKIGLSQEYEEALKNAAMIAVCTEPVNGNPFGDAGKDKCRILNLKDGKKLEDYVINETINPAEPFRGADAFCCLFRASYRNVDTGGFIISREEPYAVFISYLLGLTENSSTKNNPSKPKNGDWSLFVTYDWLNLVQNDHLPSAYQLDLLQKLAKDTNIGFKISYDTLDDLVLNISQYQYLALNLLNTIYTFLLADDTTIISRINLILLGNKPMPGCNKLTRVEALAYIYFNLFKKELQKYVERIGSKRKMLENYPQEGRKGNIVKYIDNLSKRVLELLENYSSLLEKLGNLGPYHKLNCEVLNKYIETLDFYSLIDAEVAHLLGLGEISARKNKEEEEEEIFVPIKDSFVHLAASSHVSDYFSELVNLMSLELTKLQFLDSSRLNMVVNYILKKHLNVNCRGDCVELYVTVPIQGVLKPISHAMHTPTIFPLLVNMLREEHVLHILERYSEKNAEKNAEKHSENVDSRTNIEKVSDKVRELYDAVYTELKSILTLFSSKQYKVLIRDFGIFEQNKDLGFAYIPARGHDNVLPNSLLSDALTYTTGGAGLFETRRLAEGKGKGVVSFDRLVYITAVPVNPIYAVFIKDVNSLGNWSSMTLYQKLSEAVSRAIFTNIKNIKL